MSVDWASFVELVRRHAQFLLTTHVRPDGDALGCEKALAAALRQLGKQVRIVNTAPIPRRYDFLDPEREIEAFAPSGDNLRDIDVLMVVDTGTYNQLEGMADFVRTFPGPKVVIDHHVTQDDLGARRYVDSSAEAAGRLVYDAIRALGVGLIPEIAGPLFVAVATDTGWFRHGNTTPATFALAEELMRAGAKPDWLYQQLFERISIPRLRLMGQVLSRLALAGNSRIVHSAILRSDFEVTGATSQDSEDLVNFTVGLAGVQASLLFTELEQGGVKVSFRSRYGLDVGKVAEQFGGGGHRQAAGATFNGSLDEVRRIVLAAVEKALEKNT